jgi:EAL domain-containing protein (putative c-di-GMP-specific phosphodiesterase class I)
MLASALEERERRFKLALRAGVPLLIMFSLMFYSSFSNSGFVKLTPTVALLMAGLVFITIYFIFFLLELDVKETLLDRTTEGFNQETFLKKIDKYKPKTIALISIYNLNTINDNYGVSATNDILHTFMIKLNRHIKIYESKNFWIGRNFGAEFLIAVDGDSQKVQNILQQYIEDNKTINTIEIDYRFSVISNLGTDPEKIITQLRDQVKAQEFQKNHNNPPVKDAKELSNLESHIVDALNNKSFNFYYRPLFNVRKNIIDSYEIYIKLQSSNKKEILPRDYLPVINRLGLGRNYDRIILEHIVEVALLTDDNISFSFNLSPFSLRDRDFLEASFNFIEEKKLNPQRLIFEIYERKTHHDLGKYLKTLSKIRAKGIKICIDNFGSSNASMEYMKYFKFDIVQFDRDFVSRLGDKNNISMLKSLIDMSNDLGITTVAKWVDRSEDIEILRNLGIDYVQGFGVGKPLTERQVIQKYNR